MAAQLLGPALKALASGGAKKAAVGAVKGVATDKAKDFVSGKKRKGKGGALVKSGRGGEEQVEGGKGGAIVPTTPMVGSYKVETVPDKPDEVGKPSKISYETINNQLDSIIGLTNVLKKTSAAKIKNAENRRKAERKAAEKAKKRQRESLLEKGAGKVVGMASNLAKGTEGFDPIKFFTMIFLGNLLNWIQENGSNIIAPLKAALAALNNVGRILSSGLKFLGKSFKGGLKLIGKVASPIKNLGKGIGSLLRGMGKKLGSSFGRIGKSLKNFVKGILRRVKDLGKLVPKPPKVKPPKTKAPTPKVKPPKTKAPTPKGPKGSQLLKGGVGRSTNRIILKLGGKNALKATKALKSTLGRIPIVGPLITALVSLLSGDPIGQTVFKTAGAGIGGVLGSFIPVPPPIGTLVGEIVGEYVGDLLYVMTMGGGVDAVGEKLREDWGNTIGNIVTAVLGGNKENKKPIRSHFPRGTKGTKQYQAAYNEWKNKQETGENKETSEAPEPDPEPERLMTEQEYYNARVENTGLPDTYEEYKSQFTGPTPSGSTEYGEASLLRAAKEAGYEGKELAAFMAQMAHESGNFVYDREISGGRSDYGGGGPYTLPDGTVVPAKYHGRGYIQLTHDYNYKEYGDELGIDLLSNPDLAMRGDIAAKIAILYWQKNVRPTVKGDWDNVFLHSKAINYPAATKPSQVNGMADRQAKYDKYLKKLGSGQLTKMEKSEGKPVIKPQTYTVSGITYDSSTGLPISGHEPAPAQVSPSTQSQSQMSNGITGLSQQLSYEQTGNTVVMMQASNNQQLPMVSGNGGKGTPIIMGSGDVVNSYHKSQVLGSLYKS